METRKIIYNGRIVNYAGTPGIYPELSPEQAAFYAAHPGATVEEVKACALAVAPEPDLDAYKEQARRQLRDRISAYLHDKVDHDKLNEAIIIRMTGVETESVPMQVAEDRITYYNRMNAMLKAYTLDTYLKIHECADVTAVDEVVRNIDVQSLNLE